MDLPKPSEIWDSFLCVFVGHTTVHLMHESCTVGFQVIPFLHYVAFNLHFVTNLAIDVSYSIFKLANIVVV